MVDSNSIARLIDALVKSLDLKQLGFQKNETARARQTKYPISSHLKFYIFGQQKMICSSRKLTLALAC